MENNLMEDDQNGGRSKWKTKNIIFLKSYMKEDIDKN